MDANDQDQKKLALEISKLEAEIYGLRRPWLAPALIQAVPTTLLVIATIFIAWKTGLLDVRRDLLAMQTMKLEEKNENIQKEIAANRAELERARTELAGHTEDKEAIREIQSLYPFSSLHFTPEPDERVVVLESFRFNFGDTRVVVNSGNLVAALRAVGKLRNVRALVLRKMLVRQAEGEALRELKIERLVLDDTSIDDDAVRELAKNQVLKFLGFEPSSVSDRALGALRSARPDIKINPGPDDDIDVRPTGSGRR